jgi:hypothetical protein
MQWRVKMHWKRCSLKLGFVLSWYRLTIFWLFTNFKIVDCRRIDKFRKIFWGIFQTCQHSYATKIGFYSSYKTCICEFDSHEQIQVFSFLESNVCAGYYKFQLFFTIFWEVLSLELFYLVQIPVLIFH